MILPSTDPTSDPALPTLKSIDCIFTYLIRISIQIVKNKYTYWKKVLRRHPVLILSSVADYDGEAAEPSWAGTSHGDEKVPERGASTHIIHQRRVNKYKQVHIIKQYKQYKYPV